jgi:hypothetical protein
LNLLFEAVEPPFEFLFRLLVRFFLKELCQGLQVLVLRFQRLDGVDVPFEIRLLF